MACDGAKEPLLSNLADPKSQIRLCIAPRRRLQHCRSAPQVDCSPLEANVTGSHIHTASIFGQVHPSFRKVIVLLTVYLGVGTTCFYLVTDQLTGKKTNGVLDAFYFCIVTMTTVGYGDLVPESVLPKLLACVFVFTGMALVGFILSEAADFLLEKQETLLVKALHKHEKVTPTEIIQEMEANKVWYKCLITFSILLVLVICGTTFLITVEKMDLIDAFYCVCSTITTLGYGDKSFSTEAGRIFAVIWILLSTICLAQFFLYIAELKTESRQRSLIKWVLTRRTTSGDLEAADIDEDRVVQASEFVLYKLKEMEKITQEDIILIMKEFQRLDIDQSGTLSMSDIMHTQS